MPSPLFIYFEDFFLSNLFHEHFVEDKNDTYFLTYVDDQTIFKAYGRPVYSYLRGLNFTLPEDDSLNLVYSGSRWLGMVFQGGKRRTDDNELYWVEYASGKCNFENVFDLDHFTPYFLVSCI